MYKDLQDLTGLHSMPLRMKGRVSFGSFLGRLEGVSWKRSSKGLRPRAEGARLAGMLG